MNDNHFIHMGSSKHILEKKMDSVCKEKQNQKVSRKVWLLSSKSRLLEKKLAKSLRVPDTSQESGDAGNKDNKTKLVRGGEKGKPLNEATVHKKWIC